jgi:hypothetical protein
LKNEKRWLKRAEDDVNGEEDDVNGEKIWQ